MAVALSGWLAAGLIVAGCAAEPTEEEREPNGGGSSYVSLTLSQASYTEEQAIEATVSSSYLWTVAYVAGCLQALVQRDTPGGWEDVTQEPPCPAGDAAVRLGPGGKLTVGAPAQLAGTYRLKLPFKKNCKAGQTYDACTGSSGIAYSSGFQVTEKAAVKPKPFELPEKVDLDGEPSAIVTDDLDGDGYKDLVAMVAVSDPSANGQVNLVVAWGAQPAAYVERTVLSLGKAPLTPLGSSTTRDTSTSTLALGDWDGDQRLDVVTASGVALADGVRGFAWKALPDSEPALLHPVLLLDLEGSDSLSIIRGTPAGRVERCDSLQSCVALAGEASQQCPSGAYCSIEELGSGDFDGDGRPDILGGGPPLAEPFTEGSRLWLSSQQWGTPLQTEIQPVDYQIGDLNGDKCPDLAAQQREFISDFPSHTEVWLCDPQSPTRFTKVQVLYNHDNHTDNAALADVDGDGCLDYLQIGVDSAAVGLRRGQKSGNSCTGLLGPHDPSREVDVGWEVIPTGLPSTIGIQQLDVNGDGVAEWVLREGAPSPMLHFLALPPAQ